VTPEEAARIRAHEAEPLWVTPEEAERMRKQQEAEAKRRQAHAGAPVTDAQGERVNPAVEAVHRISADFAELKEYATLYLMARVDGVKRTLRNIGLYAALGVVGLIVGGAMLATAAAMIVIAIGQVLGILFGGRIWLGYLVTGVLILTAVGIAAWIVMKKLTDSWRSKTMAKYEQLKQSQRERFGRDVSERARAEAAARRQAAAPK
jgi:hypothetical protein